MVRNDNPDRSNNNQAMVAASTTAIEIHLHLHRRTSAAEEIQVKISHIKEKTRLMF